MAHPIDHPVDIIAWNEIQICSNNRFYLWFTGFLEDNRSNDVNDRYDLEHVLLSLCISNSPTGGTRLDARDLIFPAIEMGWVVLADKLLQLGPDCKFHNWCSKLFSQETEGQIGPIFWKQNIYACNMRLKNIRDIIGPMAAMELILNKNASWEGLEVIRMVQPAFQSLWTLPCWGSALFLFCSFKAGWISVLGIGQRKHGKIMSD